MSSQFLSLLGWLHLPEAQGTTGGAQTNVLGGQIAKHAAAGTDHSIRANPHPWPDKTIRRDPNAVGDRDRRNL